MRSGSVAVTGGAPESKAPGNGLTAVPHRDRSVDRFSAPFDRKHPLEGAVAPSRASVGDRQSEEVVDDNALDRSRDRNRSRDAEGPMDGSAARGVELQGRIEGIAGEEDSPRVRPIEVERVAGSARAGGARAPGDSRGRDDREQSDSRRCNSAEQGAV